MADGKATTARVRVLGRSSLCKSGPLSIRSRALPSAVRDRTSTAQHISPGCDFGSVCSLADLVRHNADAYTAATWLWADGAQCSAVRAVPFVRRPTQDWPRASSLLRSRQAGLPPGPEWLGRTAAAATRPCGRPCCAVIQRMHARAQQCTAQHRPGAMQRIALQGSHRRRGRWRPS